MKRSLTILVTAVALCATAAVHAEKEKGPKPEHAKGPRHAMSLLPPKVEQDLSLTADQKAKVDELGAQFAKERDQWMAAHKPAKDFRAEMKAAKEANDKEKMKALQAEMREHGKPMMELRMKYMDQVRALLTPEQIAKLDDAKKMARDQVKKERKEKADDDKE